MLKELKVVRDFASYNRCYVAPSLITSSKSMPALHMPAILLLHIWPSPKCCCNISSKVIKSFPSVCDGTQNVKRYRYRYLFPVPNISDTDTGTFFGIKFFGYRFRDFFPIPNFTDTGSETYIRYQIFSIPVPIPPEKMTNSRYRYRFPL